MNALARSSRIVLALAPLALAACTTPAQPFVTSPTSEARGGNDPAPLAPTDPVEAPPHADHDPAIPRSPAEPEDSPFVGRENPPEAGMAREVPPSAPPPPHALGGAHEDGARGRYESSEQGASAKSAEARGGSAYRRPAPNYRPGLATEWGEARYSQVTSAPFQRADDSAPFASAKVFYNDHRGIEAMTGGAHGGHRSMFAVGSGFLEVGLRSDEGRFFSGFTVGGDHFVPAHAGQRYVIVVKNRSPGRLEILASVDGLDVIDGRPASYAKRGYLVEPYGEVEIEGFRTSTSAVASFRFGSVADSYAAKKHGDTRNVGVIGIAAFHERGDGPWRWSPSYPPSRPYPPPYSHDAERRLDADPFPQRFAAPPR
ncbi:MAG: hypothetical protein FJ096_17995 [Deltaproteobacteria bacterium]|nr:hypothetical protein [Deltaproteobacteria bacterium]